MSHLLIVDFNDQYHTIKRQWGNRSLNVKAMLKFLPEADFHLGVAKAPNKEVIGGFDKMLRHNGFDCRYMIGAPVWQTCTAMLIQILVANLVAFKCPETWDVTIVTGGPDAKHILSIAHTLGSKCRVFGFSDMSWIRKLPASVLTPVPLCHDIQVEDYVPLHDYLEESE